MFRFAIFCLLLLSQPAHSAPYGEGNIRIPVGMSYKGTVTHTSELKSDLDLTGYNLGFRVGWQFGSFGLGGEYDVGDYNTKSETSTTTGTMKSTDFGLYLRYAPNRLSFSAAVLGSTLEDPALKNQNLKEKLSGAGTRFGIGIRIFKVVALTVDHVSVTYDDADDEAITKVDSERKATLVGVSVGIDDIKFK